MVLSFFVCREDTSLPTSRFSAKTLDPGSGVKATSQNGYQDYASSGRGATWPSGIQATESYWQVILLSLLVMFIFLFVYLWMDSLFFSVIVWSFLSWERSCSLLLWKKSVGERLQYPMYTDFLFTAVEGSKVRNEEDPSSVTSSRANLTSIQVCGEAKLLSICCFRVQFLSWCLKSVNLCWRLMSCSMSLQPLDSELQNPSFFPRFLLMI